MNLVKKEFASRKNKPPLEKHETLRESIIKLEFKAYELRYPFFLVVEGKDRKKFSKISDFLKEIKGKKINRISLIYRGYSIQKGFYPEDKLFYSFVPVGEEGINDLFMFLLENRYIYKKY